MEAERERVGVPESSASQRGLGESDVGKRDEWGMGKKARGEDQVGLQAEERWRALGRAAGEASWGVDSCVGLYMV